MRSLLLGALVLSVAAVAQSQTVAPSGATVYATASESVILIEVRNATDVIGQASGFVVGPGLVLTNAHAVTGGTPWVKVGPVTLPATVERTDSLNDLALLRLGAEINLPPLQFVTSEPPSGTRIFALGNPRGFERTISEGLVSSSREIDGRRLLQVSAPVSPGSSGGPVLNETGEVIGVTVAMLRDAQNVNFAVPAAVAAAFVKGEFASSSTLTGLDLVDDLIARRDREQWSVDAASPYKKLDAQLVEVAGQLVPLATDTARLQALYERTRSEFGVVPLIVARRLAELAPTNSNALASYASELQSQALFKDGDEALALYRTAEDVASRALAVASVTDRRSRLWLLGQIQSWQPDRLKVAIVTLRQVVGTSRDDIAKQAALRLYSASKDLAQLADARKWFEFVESLGGAPTYYYAEYGRMLEEGLGDSAAAAASYLKAASESAYVHYCNAARVVSDLPDQLDQAISQARECLRLATVATNGDSVASYAHRLLAIFLTERGVIDQAITEARQSIAIDGTDARSFGVLADALLKAERWSEAETAARNAVRLSDGAFSSHHFALGSALFEQRRWSEAKTSFEQSAKMTPTDSASTYNVALCLTRMGFERDALYWWEETLRRNPAIAEADQIRRDIARIRSRQ